MIDKSRRGSNFDGVDFLRRSACGGFIRANWVAWGIGVAALFFSVKVGIWIGEGNLGPVNMIIGGAVVVLVRWVLPDVALMSLGITSDCWLPIPMIGFFTTPFLMALVLLVIQAVRRMMSREVSFSPIWTVNGWVILFFFWVFLRWLVQPVIPRAVSGEVADVSGFRSFSNYMNCLILCVSIGAVVRSSAGALAFLRWLGWCSVGFCFLYLAATFWPTPAFSKFLMTFGIVPMGGRLGFLRYVALPSYGLTLIKLSLLPHVLGAGIWRRIFLVLLGSVSILIGANRGTIIESVIAVGIILFLTRRFKSMLALVALAGILAVAGYHYGETGDLDPESRVTRLAGLISPRAAHASDGWQNVQWRMRRWERALNDIAERPFAGHGFGGVKGVFSMSYTTMDSIQSTSEEIDVMTGGTHNGYISTARLLGIPAVCLFLLAALSVLARNMNLAMSKGGDRTRAEIAAWCAGTLMGTLVSMLVGLEISNVQTWVYIGLGLLLIKEQSGEVRRADALADNEEMQFPMGARAVSGR